MLRFDRFDQNERLASLWARRLFSVFGLSFVLPAFSRLSPAFGRLRGAVVVVAVLVATEGQGWAIGETITDVRILDNTRTAEDTVRSIAGIYIGGTLETDTLEKARERLNSSGLFANVNVWWEQHRGGVRVNISVEDKFPWAPVPTFSWSANNKSAGLIFVHGNLLGRGKQVLVGGRIAQIDSGAILAYRDPSLFGTWMYWELRLQAGRQVIPEYDNENVYNLPDAENLAPAAPWRETTLDSFTIIPSFGVAWLRRVKTQVAYRLDAVNVRKTKYAEAAKNPNPETQFAGDPPTTALGKQTLAVGRVSISFDWRGYENALMLGSALSTSADWSSPSLGSDFDFWRAGAGWNQGFRVFRRANFVYHLSGTVGRDMPFWWDNTGGGTSLRGYLAQQFRGDAELETSFEFHFPLFSISSLDFRGLVFYDSQAVWWRHLPTTTVTGASGNVYLYREADGRTWDPLLTKLRFDRDRDVHNSVGVGLRFFLRSVAVPLVGVDFGYGLESKSPRITLVIGA